jgi:molybdopterin-guanine dinucleotide biosynthesis protein A
VSAPVQDSGLVPEFFYFLIYLTDPEGKYIGPMGGIYSCLKKASEDGLDGLFFVPCDAPLYTSEVTLKLCGYVEPETDAIIWKTADGRLQTTFGWYSVRCLPALEEDIACAGYKILKTLDKVRCKAVDTADANLEDKLFININNMKDYEELSL